MKSILFALLFLATAAHAKDTTQISKFQKGIVRIRADRRLYVEYRKAAPGKPTLFLANGLTWSTKQWQPLVAALDKMDPDIGLVLYDMVGMGKTLLEHVPVNYDIPFSDQTQDLKDLYRVLGVEGRKILCGLSYGGAVALDYLVKNPNDFSDVISMSPFLERMPDQDAWIKQQIINTRIMYPYNPATDNELYDYWLKVLVYNTYPAAEPIILENPYKLEAVYRMVKGAKDFVAFDIADQFPAGKLHLMSGVNDPYVKIARQRAFWTGAPAASHASFLVMSDTSHKLPEERPEYTASWVMQIVNGNPLLKEGLVWDGDPIKGEARSGSNVISLSKVSSCETLLRKLFGSR